MRYDKQNATEDPRQYMWHRKLKPLRASESRGGKNIYRLTHLCKKYNSDPKAYNVAKWSSRWAEMQSCHTVYMPMMTFSYIFTLS